MAADVAGSGSTDQSRPFARESFPAAVVPHLFIHFHIQTTPSADLSAKNLPRGADGYDSEDGKNYPKCTIYGISLNSLTLHAKWTMRQINLLIFME